MTKKATLFYTIVIIILTLAVGAYAVTSVMYKDSSENQIASHAVINNNNKTEDSKVELVGDYTLKSVKNNKATFMETLPDFLPGRVGEKTIDMRFFRSSQFKEGVNFKLLRIYTEDAEGNPAHKYRFEVEPEDTEK